MEVNSFSPCLLTSFCSFSVQTHGAVCTACSQGPFKSQSSGTATCQQGKEDTVSSFLSLRLGKKDIQTDQKLSESQRVVLLVIKTKAQIE